MSRFQYCRYIFNLVTRRFDSWVIFISELDLIFSVLVVGIFYSVVKLFVDQRFFWWNVWNIGFVSLFYLFYNLIMRYATVVMNRTFYLSTSKSTCSPMLIRMPKLQIVYRAKRLKSIPKMQNVYEAKYQVKSILFLFFWDFSYLHSSRAQLTSLLII